MILGDVASLIAGEPASIRVEVAVADASGEIIYVVPVDRGDYWMMRSSHAFRLLARLPAPVPVDEPATVDPPSG